MDFLPMIVAIGVIPLVIWIIVRVILFILDWRKSANHRRKAARRRLKRAKKRAENIEKERAENPGKIMMLGTKNEILEIAGDKLLYLFGSKRDKKSIASLETMRQTPLTVTVPVQPQEGYGYVTLPNDTFRAMFGGISKPGAQYVYFRETEYQYARKIERYINDWLLDHKPSQ